MKVRSIMLIAAVVVAALAVTGCGGPLDGHTYESVNVTGRELVPGTTITLSFDGGSVGVLAGCNTSTIPYQVDGDVLSIHGDGATTLMGCDPDRTRQDNWIGKWLRAGVRVHERCDSLTLEGDGVTIGFERS